MCGAWSIAAGVMLWHHPRAWFFVAGALAYALMRAGPGHRLVSWLAILDIPALLLMAVFFDTTFALAVVCGLIALLAVACEAGPLARCLRVRPLQFLGDVSYSLYLWHAPVLYAAKQVFAAGVVDNAYWNVTLFTAMSGAGGLVAAYASWRLIEQRTWLRTRPKTRQFEREAEAIAVWGRALAQTRLAAAAQSVTMEGAPDGRSRREGGFVQAGTSAVSNEGEAVCDERERGCREAGDEAQAGGEEENPPQEAAALCADRP